MIDYIRALYRYIRMLGTTVADLLWALRWLALYNVGLATWRDAKSYRHRYRSGSDTHHLQDRVVDDLYLVKIWPAFSQALLSAALRVHPLFLNSPPVSLGRAKITFVIPYKEAGVERRLGLELCIQSIAAEFGNEAKVLIVEQGVKPSASWIHEKFPGDYISTVLLEKAIGPFERSVTLNLGVARTTTDLVVLHDGDIMVVKGWRNFVQAFAISDYDVAWPALMVFYLDEAQTKRAIVGAPQRAMSCCRELESTSVLIRREAFYRIGGMDETFVGWGSEDNEFYERAMTLRVYPMRPLFSLHAWHPLANKQSSFTRANRLRWEGLRAEPVEERIKRLCALQGVNGRVRAIESVQNDVSA